MKPAIFVSSVSRELKTARQLVANTLLALGYEPVWQDTFETSNDDLRDLLRKKIDGCSAVIQIVGDAYGAEPPTVDPVYGRISYTQFEALYAKSTQKPPYYLITQPDFPQDASPEEIDGPRGDTDADLADAATRRQLQQDYKSQVQQAGTVYNPVQSLEATELVVRRIKDELAELRREHRQWQTSVMEKLDTLPEKVAVAVSRSETTTSASTCQISASEDLLFAAQRVSAALLSEVTPEPKRHVEIAEVEEQLHQFFDSEKTTVIIDGLPGAGKTTLLKRLAALHEGFYVRLNDLTEGESWWKRGDAALARCDSAFDGKFPKFIKLLADRRENVVVCLDGLERARDAALFARLIAEDRQSFPPSVKFVLGIRRTAVSAEVDRQLAGLNAQVIELPVLRDGVLDQFLSAFDVPSTLPMAMRRSLTTPFLVSVVAQAGAAESVENASLAIRSAFDDAVGAISAKQAFLHAFSRVLVNRDSYSPIPASDVTSAENRLSPADCNIEAHGSLCRTFYDRGLIIDDGRGLATTHDRLAEYLVAAELVRELNRDGVAAVANRLRDAKPDGLLWASTDFLMDMLSDDETWDGLVSELFMPLDNYISQQTDENLKRDSSGFTFYLLNFLAEGSGRGAITYPQCDWEETATPEVRRVTALLGSMYVKSPTHMTDVFFDMNERKYSWWVWVHALCGIVRDSYFFTVLNDFDQRAIETVTHALFALARKSTGIPVPCSDNSSNDQDSTELASFPGPQLPFFWDFLDAHRIGGTHLWHRIVAETIADTMPVLIDKAARCQHRMHERPGARNTLEMKKPVDKVDLRFMEILAPDGGVDFVPFTYLEPLFDYVCRVANCIQRPTVIEDVLSKIEPRSLLRMPRVFVTSYPYVTVPVLLAAGRKAFLRIRDIDDDAPKMLDGFHRFTIACAMKFAELQFSKKDKDVQDVLWTIEWICEALLASYEIPFFLRFEPFGDSISQLDSIVLRITAYEKCADCLGFAASAWEKREQNEQVQEFIVYLKTQCREACELLEAELASLGVFNCPHDDTTLRLLPEAELGEAEQNVLREVRRRLGIETSESSTADLADGKPGVETVNALLLESQELCSNGKHERALEALQGASRLARHIRNENGERECLRCEAKVLFWYCTNVGTGALVNRLKRILQHFDRLGGETRHALEVKLHLARLLGNHEDAIANSRAILNCDDDDSLESKMEAMSALFIALAQLGRTAEMDDLVAEFERLAVQCEPGYELTLRLNWLLANADIDRFQQGATEELIELMSSAMSNGSLDIALTLDAVRTLTVRLQQSADRTSKSEWYAAARKLLVWARLEHDKLRERPDLSAELRNRLRKFDTWLNGMEAEQGEQGGKNGAGLIIDD